MLGEEVHGKEGCGWPGCSGQSLFYINISHQVQWFRTALLEVQRNIHAWWAAKMHPQSWSGDKTRDLCVCVCRQAQGTLSSGWAEPVLGVKQECSPAPLRDIF